MTRNRRKRWIKRLPYGTDKDIMNLAVQFTFVGKENAWRDRIRQAWDPPIFASVVAAPRAGVARPRRDVSVGAGVF